MQTNQDEKLSKKFTMKKGHKLFSEHLPAICFSFFDLNHSVCFLITSTFVFRSYFYLCVTIQMILPTLVAILTESIKIRQKKQKNSTNTWSKINRLLESTTTSEKTWTSKEILGIFCVIIFRQQFIGTSGVFTTNHFHTNNAIYATYMHIISRNQIERIGGKTWQMSMVYSFVFDII